MNRDALGPALIALLAIVALGIGASALDTRSSGGNFGRGGGSTGIGEGSTFGLGDGQLVSIETYTGPAIPTIVLQLLVWAFFIFLLIVTLYRWREDGRDTGILVAAIVIATIGLGLFFKYTNLNPEFKSSSPSNVSLFERPLAVPGGGSGSASAEALSITSDPLLLVLAVAAALAIGIVVFFRSQDDDSTPEPDPEAEDSETMAELGRVAGRAADRIADDANADTENEVYRAWQEMTGQLAVSNPQSQTPGEFAHAATDAGMEKEDVSELTDLFRTVRYGGSAPTDERETRAVSALRRIEDEYGDES